MLTDGRWVSLDILEEFGLAVDLADVTPEILGQQAGHFDNSSLTNSHLLALGFFLWPNILRSNPARISTIH
jgi:hypothetical protein